PPPLTPPRHSLREWGEGNPGAVCRVAISGAWFMTRKQERGSGNREAHRYLDKGRSGVKNRTDSCEEWISDRAGRYPASVMTAVEVGNSKRLPRPGPNETATRSG